MYTPLDTDHTPRFNVDDRPCHDLFWRGRDAVLLMDQNGFIDCNDAALRVFYCTSKSDIISKHPSLLSPLLQTDGVPSRVKADQMIACALERGTCRFEWIHKSLTGQLFPADVTLTAFNCQKGPLMFAQVVDISDRKCNERALALATADAQRQADKATHLSQAKSQFMANMSHEIRTPMNGIIGVTDLLIDSNLTEEQAEFVDIIDQSAKQLLQIINEILDYSRMEAQKVVLEQRAFSLSRTISSVTQILGGAHAAHGLTITSSIEPDVPDIIVGDQLRLRQILINLGANAIKFTDQGKVEIVVTKLSENSKATTLHFAVKDEGIGIPSERQTQIFELFTQADASNTRTHGGTGLGLTICQQLVDLMGGKIGVDSRVGEGSTFWFNISVRTAPHHAEDIAAPIDASCAINGESPSVSTGIDSSVSEFPSPPRVLLAEDNEFNQIVIKKSLQRLGCDVEIAENGQRAVKMAFIGDFDIVFMDCHMPVMDGYEAAKAIRNQAGKSSRTPIIALTASAFPEDKNQALAAGMNGFMTKPTKRADLQRVLMEWLRPASSLTPQS